MSSRITSPELYWLPQDTQWNDRLSDLREAGQQVTLSELRAAAQQRIDFVQMLRLDRIFVTSKAAQEVPEARKVRLAVLGSSTTEHLLPGIRVGGLRRGLCLSTYTPGYAQYMQELADAESGLHRFRPTAVLFTFDAAHLIGGIGWIAEGEAAVENAVVRCTGLWREAREKFGAQVIQQTVLPVALDLLGQNEQRCPESAAHLIQLLNFRLREAADREGAHLLDLERWIVRDGLDAWHDVVLWHKAKQEISPSATPVYGDLVARLLAAQRGLSGKCLVLDLDNTLWGGVIGDDGLEGIVMGNGSSAGESFLAFQAYARALARRGVILAVCSKNDESAARLPFEKHPEMLLRLADIACFVANWEDKAGNLRRIAEQLNIGIDSLVFVDDSPFERELVRRELPEVAVPEMPAEPAHQARCLADAGYFELLHLTREDRERSQSYQANQQREQAREQATDLPAYLRELRMELIAQPFDLPGLPRIVQLIHKTNQFNLTTRRFSEEEVRAAMAERKVLTMQLRLRDRFGDNGIIALLLGRLDDQRRLWIELWLMSCRVLGRTVEEATMNRLVAAAREMGAREIAGVYRPSSRNHMVEQHYRKMGFQPLDGSPDGESWWRLNLDQYQPLPDYMQESNVSVEVLP